MLHGAEGGGSVWMELGDDTGNGSLRRQQSEPGPRQSPALCSKKVMRGTLNYFTFSQQFTKAEFECSLHGSKVNLKM